ncbi:MAG: hypothetical protein UT77_C0002G0027 [Candidatus Daviesbacteria bacterium GW2011_GWC2_40_12]|uniref:Uncharacterized protein n=1 Tax=Candidatus Daviesbacteria bacterium GW2011_GWC2_40_12 TaxID=1618431 RepID=A0A0G0QPL9_9BACT|nr:MAG: hypothetical protein UT45_C0004G0176 [Candidatus Daviesbacteria bacterium GW2011_GWA2_39_33]KKR42374.1 MAG: hypothetical protein UT77_C0002G0027 [Candidatus Daviesbacteria bacterium GW2011_GWC2_40_12]
MFKFFAKKSITLISIFSLFINIISPLALAGQIYAQEASPAPVVEEAPAPSANPGESPVPTTNENTPAEASPAPEVSPTPEPSPVVSPEPSPSQVSEPVLEETANESSPAAVVDPTPQEQTSATPVWQNIADKEFTTSENVTLGNEYTAPQNDKVKVQFTKLPDPSGKLTIKEVKLTPEEMTSLGAFSDTAYDITSTMSDSTFEYDLTLPLPQEAQNKEVEVKAAETEEQISQATEVTEQKEKKTQDTITIKGLNHFTVFVITTPSPDTTQRVLINEILPNPTAGAEWVEFFNNGTTSVNLGAGTGWTITNSVGSIQSLSALGTIPAAGRVVFDAPAGWLSNTAPETITISNELGTVVDTVTVSLIAPGFAIDHYPLAGESVGRRTDGVNEWLIFTTPSKGTANVVPVVGGAGRLAEVGPVAPAGGLRAGSPNWYRDNNNLTLELMEAADANGISAPVEAGNPFSAQIGFGAEGFWWSAEADLTTSAGSALLVQAIEAAFAGESAVDGEQSSFARIRIRVDVGEPGTYIVTYPYGQKTYTVTTPGVRAINDTVDIGCFAQPGVSCDQVGQPNFSTLLNGGIGPFLTWDTFNSTGPSDPALNIGGRRYVGTVATPHTVKGSPTGNNFFRIQGPNIGGPGINVIQTNLFTVTGRLAGAGAPVITLHGANPVNVLQNAPYTATEDAGATALDDVDGNLTANIQITGLPVNTATIGAKTVTYTVTDSAGNTATATRTVNVVETSAVDGVAPVITIAGNNPATVVAGTAYIDAGATALDNVDGAVAVSTTGLPVNTSVVGSATVTYTATDAAGNTASLDRIVNIVADNVAPTITITGSNPVFVFIGGTYTDAGATCTDNVDGDCTALIITSGAVIDTSAAGSHTVNYAYTDAAGNNTSVNRTVNVAATLPAGLVEVGPVAPAGGLGAGFPEWYKDSNALILDLMEAADPHSISAPVEAGNAFSETLGFGAEGFWWATDADMATSGPNGAILVQAVEAAFAGESAVDGEQSAFARVRIRIDVGEPGTYTVTYPFGTKTYDVLTVGPGFEINDTSDIGCFAQPGISCDQAGQPNFSTVLSGEIGPFLTWDTFDPNPVLSDPLLTHSVTNRRYVGDGITPHIVKGSPTGNNFFRIEGPNIGGAGVNSVQTNLFTVVGRLDNAVNPNAPVITVVGANPVTVLLNDPYTAVQDAGATATDVPDGDLTASIIESGLPVDTSTVGAKTVTYTVTDANGNTVSATRTINVVAALPADVTPPVITVLGANPITVTVGSTYAAAEDAGATAFDAVDGVVVVAESGLPVDTSTEGAKTVTYTSTDAAGNTATITRTVNVTSAPVTTGSIRIIKDTVLNNAQDFEFRLRLGAFDQTFFLDDDSDNTLPNVREFEGLATGAYNLQEIVNSNWNLISISCNDPDSGTTFDLGASTATIDLDAGERVTCEFTNAPRQSIAGEKFSDQNNNGVKEAGEPGLSGWTIYLDTNDNGVLDGGETSVVTDSEGDYQFLSVSNGVVNVREVTQSNWQPKTPSGGKYVLTMTSNSSFISKDFGNAQILTIPGASGRFFSTGGPVNSTTSVVADDDNTISVAGNGGTTTILIPEGTVITKSDGGTIDFSQLTSAVLAASAVSGLGSGVVVDGVLQWGIPNLGLLFSQPITINFFIGTAFNGQTLNIQRSISGSGGWTTDGIVAPATCTVSAGVCSFQTTKASFFASTHNVPADNNTGSGTSGNNNSTTSAPTCNDVKPGSAPTLLSAVATGANEVTLTWSKAADPVTGYMIAFGLTSGDLRFGDPNQGSKNDTQRVIKNLSGGTTYFFRVKAANGCNASDYSNEIAVKATGQALSTNIPAGFQEGVLGAQTDQGSTGTGGAIDYPSPTPSVDDVLGTDSQNVGVGQDQAQGQTAGARSNTPLAVGVALVLLTILGVGYTLYRRNKLQ